MPVAIQRLFGPYRIWQEPSVVPGSAEAQLSERGAYGADRRTDVRGPIAARGAPQRVYGLANREVIVLSGVFPVIVLD